MPNYALSIGLSPQQGSIVAAILNLGLGIGQPLFGYFSDSVGRINIAGFATLMCGLSCLVLWIPARNFGVLLLFAFIAGAAAGSYWTTVAPVAAEIVGMKQLPGALSLTLLVIVLPTACKFLDPEQLLYAIFC